MYLWSEIQNEDDIDIIIVNESWFKDEEDSQMYIPGYILQTHADRKGRRGGGTAIYTRIGLKCHSAKSIVLGTWVQWSQISVKDLIVATFYRSPQSTPTDNRKLIAQIRTLKNKRAIISADANLPDMIWEGFDSAATMAKYSMERDMTMLCHEVGLKQHVKHPTRFHKQTGTASILDVVLTTDKEILIGEPEVLSEDFFDIKDERVGGSDHRSVKFNVAIEDCKPSEQVVTIIDYHKINWARYRDLVKATRIKNIPIKQCIEACKDLDEAIEIINSAMSSAFLSCVETHDIIIDGSPPWSGPKLTKNFRKARSLRKRFKRDPRKFWLRDKWLLQLKKNRCQSKKLRLLFEARKLKQMEKDTKALYNYVKQLRGQKESIGPLKNKDGIIVYTDHEMAEVLAEHYVSVNNPAVKPDVNWTPSGEAHELTEVCCDPILVRKIIDDFKCSKSIDSDEMSVFLLKQARDQLAPLISVIAHRSINVFGKFPQSQKHGVITPLYKGKKSCRNTAKNYRPITINGTVGKVIETCASNALRNFLESNNLLDKEQFGFRQKRSTTHHLVLTWKDIISAMRAGTGNTLLSIDLTAAFDKILHHLLLRKLRSDGIAGKLGSWFESWTVGRTCSVKVGSAISAPRDVTSGIGQGTILGPLLFVYSVSGSFRKLKLLTRSYADDTSGSFPVNSDEDADSLQADIDSIVAWADDNGMQISVPKCRIQRFGEQLERTFYIKGEAIPVGNSEELLGVTLATSCRFTDHVNKVLGKCYSIMNLIEKNIKSRDINLYRRLYCTYINGIMSYASQVWFENDKHVIKLFLGFWKKFWHMTGHDPPQDLLDPIQQFLLNDLLFMKKWADGKFPMEFGEHFQVTGANATKKLRSFTSGKLELKQEAFNSKYNYEFGSRVLPYFNSSHLDLLRTEENFNKFRRIVRKLIVDRKISYENLPGSNKATASA